MPFAYTGRKTGGKLLAAALWMSLYPVAPAFGNIVIASGAGPLPASAQDLTGAFPTEIKGTLDGIDQNDVSMFKIRLYDPLAFSAFTAALAFGIPDTVLTLFDASGVGVYLNDDISGNTLSCLPSGNASNPCPSARNGNGPIAGGIYFLAISRGANYPIDGFGNEIFSPLSSTDAIGPSVTNPIAGWDGGAFTSSDFDLVRYDINLTGTLAGAGTVPEPDTGWLIGAAALLLGLCRRLARPPN